MKTISPPGGYFVDFFFWGGGLVKTHCMWGFFHKPLHKDPYETTRIQSKVRVVDLYFLVGFLLAFRIANGFAMNS